MLELIDKDGKQHPYYVTAKRIVEFSKMMKDKYNVEFPILGICQGLEVISVIQGQDDIGTLDDIPVWGMRKVDWIEKQKTRFFDEFPEDLRQEMEDHRSGLHLHNFAVSFETFNKVPGLHKEMIITQQDESNGIKFIGAMEHKKYPIFTIMYHPEYLVVENAKLPTVDRTKSFVRMTD